MPIYEMEEEMDAPCVCNCGRLVEQSEMNPCDMCNDLWCDECLEEPWETCPKCK